MRLFNCDGSCTTLLGRPADGEWLVTDRGGRVGLRLEGLSYETETEKGKA
jgi:hypothetical protein